MIGSRSRVNEAPYFGSVHWKLLYAFLSCAVRWGKICPSGRADSIRDGSDEPSRSANAEESALMVGWFVAYIRIAWFTLERSSPREVGRANHDGSVFLCVAGEILLPGFLLNSGPMSHEDLEPVFHLIALEMIIQRFAANRAKHTRLPVQAPELDRAAIEIVCRV